MHTSTGWCTKAARICCSTRTLQKMADGGIHDHIGGGFQNLGP
ncbi:MAG: hypothetical protein PHC61_17905 [Chitinivibrionales bacterium]|nr:hypothetical protein [Chitinivibrionales bacterium]